MSNLNKSPKNYEWSEEERLASEKFKKEKSEGKHKNSMYIPHYPNKKQTNLKAERYLQSTTLRWIFAIWVGAIITLWLVFTGMMFMKYGKTYAVEVMCMLLGTTTANVLGLGFIVLKGLFPQNKE